MYDSSVAFLFGICVAVFSCILGLLFSWFMEETYYGQCLIILSERIKCKLLGHDSPLFDLKTCERCGAPLESFIETKKFKGKIIRFERWRAVQK